MEEAWQRLLVEQSGVARRDQLRACGLGTAALRGQLRARRWQSFEHTMIVNHNGPLTRPQQQWVAVLACGNGAMLAGLTALEVGGLRNYADPRIHVLSRRARARSFLPSAMVVVHETRVDPGRPLTGRGAPPRASVQRAAVDAASWHQSTRRAAGLLAAVVQQRLTTPARLKSAFEAAGPIRHRRLIRLTIDDIAGGAEALSEIDFAQLTRKHRLGTVSRQVIRYDDKGRRRYLDGQIVGPTGRRRSFEVDGSIHMEPEQQQRDYDRQNEMSIRGELPLKFTAYAVRFEEPKIVDQLRRAVA